MSTGDPFDLPMPAEPPQAPSPSVPSPVPAGTERDALARVLALHVEVDGDCEHCTMLTDGHSSGVPWPCETALAAVVSSSPATPEGEGVQVMLDLADGSRVVGVLGQHYEPPYYFWDDEAASSPATPAGEVQPLPCCGGVGAHQLACISVPSRPSPATPEGGEERRDQAWDTMGPNLHTAPPPASPAALDTTGPRPVLDGITTVAAPPAETRQCALTSSGHRCALPQGHMGWHAALDGSAWTNDAPPASPAETREPEDEPLYRQGWADGLCYVVDVLGSQIDPLAVAFLRSTADGALAASPAVSLPGEAEPVIRVTLGGVVTDAMQGRREAEERAQRMGNARLEAERELADLRATGNNWKARAERAEALLASLPGEQPGGDARAQALVDLVKAARDLDAPSLPGERPDDEALALTLNGVRDHIRHHYGCSDRRGVAGHHYDWSEECALRDIVKRYGEATA